MSECCTIQPSHPTALEDELIALALQLEEIGIYAQAGKGKHAIDRPPDSEVACASFRAELQNHQTLLADQRIARSIGAAVHSDGAVIADFTAEEIQCHEDRLFAFRNIDPAAGDQKPPKSMFQKTDSQIQNWLCAATESQYAGSLIDFPNDSGDEESEAGPSMSFAERQADVLSKLSQRIKCAVCHEHVYSNRVISLPCKDRYCVDCLKGLFMRATKDETLFPVRCCKKPIPQQLISRHMSADELAAVERASIEFTTADRVYCSDRSCARFIPQAQIEAGTNKALCEDCGTLTCALCKNNYHRDGNCPDDPALHTTRELAGAMGWQSCYRCGNMVSLVSGCNHMTCRCKAQFCYECGTPWKKCKCAHANPDRILERAEEIVDRDAEIELPQAERQRRVRQVRTELDQNHECEHPGRFQRIFQGGRRGFRCEMCDDRHWKYILQCRHCFINVCEDCRRNRV